MSLSGSSHIPMSTSGGSQRLSWDTSELSPGKHGAGLTTISNMDDIDNKLNDLTM